MSQIAGENQKIPLKQLVAGIGATDVKGVRSGHWGKQNNVLILVVSVGTTLVVVVVHEQRMMVPGVGIPPDQRA